MLDFKMKITLDGKALEVKEKATVADVLAKANINAETVLVKRANVLIPHDTPLKEADVLELVTVISGG